MVYPLLGGMVSVAAGGRVVDVKSASHGFLVSFIVVGWGGRGVR